MALEMFTGEAQHLANGLAIFQPGADDFGRGGDADFGMV
jgi:hypothetical protein